MKITPEDLNHLTNLAKLELSDQEKKLYLHQLSEILEFVEKLQEVKIKSSDLKLEKNKNLRTDSVVETTKEDHEAILEQFAERRDNLLKTKSIFDRK